MSQTKDNNESLFIYPKDVAKLLQCSEDKARKLLKSGLIKSCIWNNNELRTQTKYVELFVEQMINGEISVKNNKEIYDIVHPVTEHLSIEDQAKSIAEAIIIKQKSHSNMAISHHSNNIH